MDPRPSTSPPSLPIELTDLIVDDLQSNHQALLSCSLVSRDWLPRSRHHLFRQLRCHPQTSDGFSELWSFFQSSPADLRGVVRELTLDGTQTSFRAATHHNGSDPNDYHLTFPLLASCVALLPSLESLKLTNIFLGGVGGRVDVTEVGRMKKPQHRIKNLWLYGIRSSRNGGRFCSVVDVHAILALFGVVDQLSLSYLGFFPLDQELQSSVATYFGPRFQTRVQNLKVAHRCTRLDTLLEFLRRRHMLEQTNHLAIRVSDRIGSEFPFHTIGSQFSSMELDIGDNALLLPPSPTQIRYYIDPDFLTSLRSLTFQLRVPNRRKCVKRAWLCVATLFPALPTCLEHLTISLLFRWGNSGIDWLSLIEEEWFEIHDSLEDLTQLQEVTVALQDEKDQSMTFFEKMNDILLVRFPTLHQRGQLRIVFPGQ